jgi:hypothetical protein
MTTAVLRPRTAPAAIGAALLLLATAVSATAQTARPTGTLTVSATVVRSCTIENPRTETLPGVPQPTGEPIKIRCGNTTLLYPFQPGPVPTPTPVKGRDPVPTVNPSPNGQKLVIQF